MGVRRAGRDHASGSRHEPMLDRLGSAGPSRLEACRWLSPMRRLPGQEQAQRRDQYVSFIPIWPALAVAQIGLVRTVSCADPTIKGVHRRRIGHRYEAYLTRATEGT